MRIQLVSLLGLFAGGLSAEPPPDRPSGTLTKQTYTSPIDGAAIDYALWLPPGYKEGASWPLIVFLHGSGEGKHWKSPTQTQASVPVLGSLHDLPFVVVFPLMRGSWSISALAERDVLDTIAAVRANFTVDPDRVHLVGLSLGGFAAWRVACRYRATFASLTVFCGGGEPDLAVNLRHIPVQVFHGARDSSVPVDRSREMVAALERADIPVHYTEYPQGKHVIWREALGSPLLYHWMTNQVRARHPRRISYRTHTLRYASAYWARIESVQEPSEPACIDVFVPPGQDLVLVHAENVGHLVLEPPTQIIEPGREPRFVVNDLPVRPVRSDHGWVVELGRSSASELKKRPGLSGPIQDVLNDAFVVTVPTLEAPESNRHWRKAAYQSLAWVRKPVTSNVQTVPDHAVTQELMDRAHLICFGDPTNHAVLQQLADRLPLRAGGGRLFVGDKALSPWAIAFVMIYPNPLAPDRYIVVCSGHPDAVARLAAATLTPPMLNQPPIEDLVVMLGDGELVPWRDQPGEPPGAALPMGARTPPRGPVFDHAWSLTPAARAWLESIPAPPWRTPATRAAPASRPGPIGATSGGD